VKSKSGGLSQIELLTILAVIAVVAAILFPVLATTHEKERNAQCSTNLRAIGSAIAMYEKDNGERALPCSETWWRPLKRYLRAESGSAETGNFLICPSTPSKIGLPPEPWRTEARPRDLEGLSAYAYNIMLGGAKCGDGTREYGPPKLVTQVVYPRLTVRITEMWRIASNDGYGIAYPPAYQALHSGVEFKESLSPQFVLPPGWHNGRSWVLWVDGHVSDMPTCRPRIPAEFPNSQWQIGVMENNPANKWFTTSGLK